MGAACACPAWTRRSVRKMRSTGEVMDVGVNFGEAFLKAQISAGSPLPEKGTVFIGVNDHHKAEAVKVAGSFADLGFKLVATGGTADALRNAGLTCKTVLKVNEGRPNVVDLLKGGAIQLAVYTTTGAPAFHNEKAIRRSAVTYRVPGRLRIRGGARAAKGGDAGGILHDADHRTSGRAAGGSCCRGAGAGCVAPAPWQPVGWPTSGFVDRAALHHHLHAPNRRDLFRRVAIHGDQIGQHPRLHLPDLHVQHLPGHHVAAFSAFTAGIP